MLLIIYLQHYTATCFAPCRAIVRENITRYCIEQLHNNTWSVVYVDLPVIIRVVIFYTVD
jgi:hypothetical protein